MFNKAPIQPKSNLPHSFNEIIYIMGMGRSGTTILDIVISNNPNILSCGEVTHIFRDGFISNSACACGEQISNCELWRSVASEFSQDNLDLIQSTIDKIESHKSFFLSIFNFHNLETESLYKETNARIFNNLSNKTDITHIIDSSKYAGRALGLSKAFPDKIKIILLTRSPEGLYTSFKKENSTEQRPKSTFQILLYYFYTLSCFKLSELKLKNKILKLQYDDFISSPTEALTKIENWANIDLSESKKLLGKNEKLNIGHIVTGNRLRKNGKIKFLQNLSSSYSNDISFKISVGIMNLYRKLLKY